MLAPVTEEKVINNYPLPVFDEAGILIGYETQDVVALIWDSVQFGARFHFQYRAAGSNGVWLNAPAEYTNALAGKSSIILPFGNYEYLPYPVV